VGEEDFMYKERERKRERGGERRREKEREECGQVTLRWARGRLEMARLEMARLRGTSVGEP